MSEVITKLLFDFLVQEIGSEMIGRNRSLKQAAPSVRNHIKLYCSARVQPMRFLWAVGHLREVDMIRETTDVLFKATAVE